MDTVHGAVGEHGAVESGGSELHGVAVVDDGKGIDAEIAFANEGQVRQRVAREQAEGSAIPRRRGAGTCVPDRSSMEALGRCQANLGCRPLATTEDRYAEASRSS